MAWHHTDRAKLSLPDSICVSKPGSRAYTVVATGA